MPTTRRTRDVASKARNLTLWGVMLLSVACQSRPASEEARHPSAPPAAETSSQQATEQLTLRVEDLTCEGCAWQIRDTLEKVAGVSKVETTVADKKVVVSFEPGRISADAIVGELAKVGYESERSAK